VASSISVLATLIITPTYNERDNLACFVASVHAAAPEAHVLIVDDASPDGTGELAAALSAADARVVVLHRAAKLGLGSAYVEGFRYALAHGYDVILEMDADLSHDPAYLPAFIAAIAGGADLATGSRNIQGGGVEGWGLGRHLLSKGGSIYARTILGVPIRDLTTGYKAYSRRAIEAIGIERLRSNGYAFQVETTYRVFRRGLRVVELPIVFVDRRAGQSKMSRRIFAEAVVEVWRLRLEALLGRL
jgi:dolichol-phosphate mannosyltransferase